jgi:hypothetical protein
MGSTCGCRSSFTYNQNSYDGNFDRNGGTPRDRYSPRPHRPRRAGDTEKNPQASLGRLLMLACTHEPHSLLRGERLDRTKNQRTSSSLVAFEPSNRGLRRARSLDRTQQVAAAAWAGGRKGTAGGQRTGHPPHVGRDPSPATAASRFSQSIGGLELEEAAMPAPRSAAPDAVPAGHPLVRDHARSGPRISFKISFWLGPVAG